MMRREFSKREKVLLLVLAFMILALLYYVVVQKTIVNTTRTAQLRINDAQAELEIEEIKLERMLFMQEKLDAISESEAASVSRIADYDNIQPLMIELNNILAKARGYNLGFLDIDFTEGLARRTIKMSFSADSYATAKSILEALATCKYKSLVGSVGFSSGQDDLMVGNVSVQLDITFYEFYE
ncbi:MAG: hypothetical protein EOM59_05000 [Clostridia bacterium]|nr:hypothetical protein [Clostridia bacterium]